MFQKFVALTGRLWADDRGSIIATEYLALGGLVAIGSTAGLEAIRDATVDEMREYGHSVRAIRQQANAPQHTRSESHPAGGRAARQPSYMPPAADRRDVGIDARPLSDCP